MRQLGVVLAIGTGALLAYGCSESSSRAPTQPRADIAPATVLPCDKTLATQITAQISVLFSSSVQKSVSSSWKTVQQTCPKSLPDAVTAMLNLVQLSIDLFHGGSVVAASPEQSLIAWWGMLFTYVGQQLGPLSPAVLDPPGAAAVCGAAGCGLITGDTLAGLLVPLNAVGETHLFTIAPASCNPVVATTNLDLVPPCYDYSVNPVTTFSVPVTVTICQEIATVATVFGRAQIGHLVTVPTGVVKLTPKAGNPFPGVICPDAALGAASPPSRSLYVNAWRGVVHLASSALSFFAPTPLYATHTSLSGGTKSFSTFGAVDPLVFLADFNNAGNVVGSPPGPPEKGTWTQIVQPPGSILVQSSISDLTTQPVVLNQAGGNCGTSCGVLQLTGTVHGIGNATQTAPATVGTYVVSWRSVESKPSIKDVPFVLRSSDSSVVARLEYLPGQGAQSGPIAYNGAPLQGVTWQQNVTQSFAITVNLDARTTSLSIGGQPVAGAQNVPFATSTASDLQSFGAELSGIDAGVLGVDDVKIIRTADAP